MDTSRQIMLNFNISIFGVDESHDQWQPWYSGRCGDDLCITSLKAIAYSGQFPTILPNSMKDLRVSCRRLYRAARVF